MLMSFETRKTAVPDGPDKTVEVYTLRCYDTTLAIDRLAYWPGRTWWFRGVQITEPGVRATFPTEQLAKEALFERGLSFVWF